MATERSHSNWQLIRNRKKQNKKKHSPIRFSGVCLFAFKLSHFNICFVPICIEFLYFSSPSSCIWKFHSFINWLSLNSTHHMMVIFDMENATDRTSCMMHVKWNSRADKNITISMCLFLYFIILSFFLTYFRVMIFYLIFQTRQLMITKTLFNWWSVTFISFVYWRKNKNRRKASSTATK